MPRFAAIATIIPQVLSSTWVLAVVAAANLVVPAAAQMPVSIQAVQDPKERCAQDIAFFDRYGSGRTENSDGQRNHTRIGAEIDCQRGRYEKGITAMEDLLRRKKFDVPLPSWPTRDKVEKRCGNIGVGRTFSSKLAERKGDGVTVGILRLR